jgi:glycosyltransferase involved in cell wall biosynthesis
MGQLRVCIVGPIYDMPEDYRRKRLHTPETILARGLKSRGVDVVESGHRGFLPSSGFDVVHVHHLGKAALVMATSPSTSRFVFTGHDPRIMNNCRVSWRRTTSSRFVVSRADAIVTLSDTELDFTRARFPASRRKSVTIANGLPSDVFFHAPRDKRPSLPDRLFRLLFVGQLIPMKGVDVLLKAVKILESRRKIELQLAYQSSWLESSYRELAAQLGIADRVHFLGLKSAAELAELYRSADLFVLPSNGEALPAVVTEAMMCGLPVVATRVGGVRDQVGPYGYVIEPGDPAKLAVAIDRALGDVAEGRFSNAEIGRYATERFSVESMVGKHLALYRGLLTSGWPPERLRAKYWLLNSGGRVLLDTAGRRLSGKGLLE